MTTHELIFLLRGICIGMLIGHMWGWFSAKRNSSSKQKEKTK